MSDPRIVGPSSAIVVPLADAAQQFRASPPFQQSVGLACFGAITLGFSGEAAVLFGPAASTFSPVALLVFAGIVATGLLLFVLGVRGARGPRNGVMALTSVATPGGLAVALWWLGGPQAFHNIWVQLIGIPFLIGFVVRLYLSVRGMPGDAQRNVRRHIEQNENVWRSDRRR
jgi:hypothetical protein